MKIVDLRSKRRLTALKRLLHFLPGQQAFPAAGHNAAWSIVVMPEQNE